MNEELILKIDVLCTKAFDVAGKNQKVVMVYFTGETSGKYFTGKTVDIGCDTQKYTPEGNCFLSARYMLEGKDYTGADCRIFIENTTAESGIGLKPKITTDSKALSEWEDLELRADVTPVEGGVCVQIFRQV